MVLCCVCVHVYEYFCHVVCMGVREQPVGVGPLPPTSDPGDRSQVVGLEGNGLYPLSRFAGPKGLFYIVLCIREAAHRKGVICKGTLTGNLQRTRYGKLGRQSSL